MRASARLVLACAALALGAAAPDQLDAAKLGCAQFRELGPSAQKRILSFLQGYGQREVPEDKVGSVAIGGGLARLVDACAKTPGADVAAKVREVASGQENGARGEARLTRPPTQITCKAYDKLSREDQRLTVYWLDGYSRKVDPGDANQSVLSLSRDPENMAKKACSKRAQRLWWAIQGSARSVDAAR